jgi:hypothetical protein
MFELLTNIYVLPLIITLCGLIMMNLYLRISKKDDEYTKSSYIKCGTSIYLTSLATLVLNNKLSSTSQFGGSSFPSTSIPSVSPPSYNNMNDNFNVGKVPF